jgi:hypothetical protein
MNLYQFVNNFENHIIFKVIQNQHKLHIITEKLW